MDPVLVPEEEKKLKKFCRIVKTPYRDLYMLKRKKDGFCIFFNKKSGRCKIYDKRPMDCRIFPLHLYLDKNGVNLKFDRKICPEVKNGQFDKAKLLKMVRKYSFPEDYRKAFNTIEWHSNEI